MIAKIFLPNYYGKKIVNHKDGNKTNCKLYNLEWCTSSENSQHAHDILLNKTAKKGKILLIRSNSDGSFYKRKFKYMDTNFLDEDLNPTIRDGDIIFVDRNNWTKSVDTLKTVVSPISPIINAVTLYKIIND